jgi:hypothetical protein
MHMNSAPHLLSEDHAEFERILDAALRDELDRPDLAPGRPRLNAEQLRTMALGATALIATAAAAEYARYAKLREELRSPPPAEPVQASVLSPAMSEVAESGAGFAAVIAVLVPVLAGTAAVIFLLVGYLLKALDPPPAFAASLLAVGWFFGAVTVLGILAAAVALLITALRNSSTELPAMEAGGELPPELARAREDWRDALLERGIVPFLRSALAEPATGAAPGTGAGAGADPDGSARADRGAGRGAGAATARHLPKIGYSRPNFSSPDDGSTAGRRPTYSSPDFSSPDYGGPEHRPE